MTAPFRDWNSIIEAGEYETCLDALDALDINIDLCLNNAARHGCVEMVQLMIDKGAEDLAGGLISACAGGHVDAAKLMMKKGASAWDWGLFRASYNGHIPTAQLMLAAGAKNTPECIRVARLNGHDKTVRYLQKVLEGGPIDLSDQEATAR